MLMEAFRALDDLELPWALLRGEDELARPEGDVDVLVGVRDVRAVDRALGSVGFRRLPAAGRGSHRFYFRYDVAAQLWLKLDLVSRVDYGDYQELRTTLGVGCLAASLRVEPVRRLQPEDQAWLLLLHLLLDKGCIPRARRQVAVPGYVHMGLWRANRWDGVATAVPGARLARVLLRAARTTVEQVCEHLTGHHVPGYVRSGAA